jgi:hypothetical protein
MALRHSSKDIFIFYVFTSVPCVLLHTMMSSGTNLLAAQYFLLLALAPELNLFALLPLPLAHTTGAG